MCTHHYKQIADRWQYVHTKWGYVLLLLSYFYILLAYGKVVYLNYGLKTNLCILACTRYPVVTSSNVNCYP